MGSGKFIRGFLPELLYNCNHTKCLWILSPFHGHGLLFSSSSKSCVLLLQAIFCKKQFHPSSFDLILGFLAGLFPLRLSPSNYDMIRSSNILTTCSVHFNPLPRMYVTRSLSLYSVMFFVLCSSDTVN